MTQDSSGLGAQAARVRLAARQDTAPDLLHQLATDPEVTVRAAVAMNTAVPPALHRTLAADADGRVRALLAGKIAALLPSLDRTAHDEAFGHVRTTLATLVEDEATRVRHAIADAVKAMPDAPRALILRLAFDPAIAVCGPVIRLSPLLTDSDLLALLAAPPHADIPCMVAQRAGLSARVSDAVLAKADSAAISAMLVAQADQASLKPELARDLQRRPADQGRDGPAQQQAALACAT